MVWPTLLCLSILTEVTEMFGTHSLFDLTCQKGQKYEYFDMFSVSVLKCTHWYCYVKMIALRVPLCSLFIIQGFFIYQYICCQFYCVHTEVRNERFVIVMLVYLKKLQSVHLSKWSTHKKVKKKGKCTKEKCSCPCLCFFLKFVSQRWWGVSIVGICKVRYSLYERQISLWETNLSLGEKKNSW